MLCLSSQPISLHDGKFHNLFPYPHSIGFHFLISYQVTVWGFVFSATSDIKQPYRMNISLCIDIFSLEKSL